jgi:predicted O-linked N-acetylglucosamine transferase (SPINDLY family)
LGVRVRALTLSANPNPNPNPDPTLTLTLTLTRYPGGLGGGLVDYLTADSAVAPPRAAWQYAERLVLLPRFFLAADHGQLGTAGAAARNGGGGGGGGESGGGAGGGTAALVLSSFSQPYKVAPETLQAWLAAMRRLPPSTSLVRLQPKHAACVPPAHRAPAARAP